LSIREKAFIIASIQKKVEQEKAQQRKMKKPSKKR